MFSLSVVVRLDVQIQMLYQTHLLIYDDLVFSSDVLHYISYCICSIIFYLCAVSFTTGFLCPLPTLAIVHGCLTHHLAHPFLVYV